MTNILLGIIAYVAVIAAVVLAYAAGPLDGSREGWCQQHPSADAPIQMEHTRGGEEE